MKLTDEQFNYFKNRVYHWADFFKLYDWQITVDKHLERSKDETRTAYVSLHSPTHSATVYIIPEWDLCNINEVNLNRTALHEVCHILTADIEHFADSRCNPDSVNRAVEAFAIRMVNIITGKFDEEL